MTAHKPNALAHFQHLYRTSDDPWRVRDSWYEQRKRALILACLPQPRYRSAYEPGCGNGELSAALALRCDRLLASDAAPAAVALARARVKALTRAQDGGTNNGTGTGTGNGVSIEHHVLPADWPPQAQGCFDLIVISELAYYLDDTALQALAAHCVASLQAGGALLLCHWRHPFDDRLQDSAALHAAFEGRAELAHAVHHDDTDFLLDVWTRPGTQGENT